MARLEAKVAIITGGGTGIGAVTAKRFAEEGARVVVCGRRIEPLQEVVKAIESAGGEALAVSCDVSDPAAVKHLMAETLNHFGRLDIVVNNATLIVPELLASHSDEGWHDNFRVTVDGTMHMMREAYPELVKHGGAVVNVSSIVGQLGTPYMSGYAAAKSAVNGLTRNAAMEWAQDGVRVNAVIPGGFLTEPTKAVIPDDAAKKAMEATIPIRRIGDPVECANAILFLASEEASYITGVLLNVDGGRSAELNIGAASME